MKQSNLSYNISKFKMLEEDIFKDAKDFIITKVKEIGVQDSAMKSVYCYVPSNAVYLPSVSCTLKKLDCYTNLFGAPTLEVHCGNFGALVKYSHLKIDDVIAIVEHLMYETK